MISINAKVALFFIAILGLWATPSFAKITEIETNCGLFDCYSIFSIDRDLTTIKDYTYKVIGDTKVGDKRSFDYGEFSIHQGSIKDIEIEILKDGLIKISGKIGGATKNLWGFSLLGDTSHLHSTWWNSDFEQCMNWTITEVNGTDRINQPVIYNATGLINKTANSNDFRIVNAACGLGGAEQAYEILSNTSTSVYFATFINATANATTYYSFYWYNNTPVAVGDDPDLFLYANNGTTEWDSDGGSRPVTRENDYLDWDSLDTPANTYNFTNMTYKPTTGNWWFSYELMITQTDPNGVTFGLGDDFLGQGGGPFSAWVAILFDYDGAYYCYDATHGFVTMLNPTSTNVWYTVRANTSLDSLDGGSGNLVNIDNEAWAECGNYPAGTTVDSIDQLRLHGDGGDTQIKNIFLSNTSFNTYNKPLTFATEGIAYKPPDVVTFYIVFSTPTPDDDTTRGFDYDTIINLSATLNGTTITAFVLDWDGTNVSKGDMGNYADFSGSDLNISAGNVYTYRGWITTPQGNNVTETRTYTASTFTTDEAANQFGLDDLLIILLFVVLGIIVFIIFFR